MSVRYHVCLSQSAGAGNCKAPARTPMDLQATIGLGLLTLGLGAIAIMGTNPENRVPYAFHITFVTGLAYIVSRLN